MKFSFETPINYLKELDKNQDYLFIISSHLNNKKYYDYCKNSKKFKILDNAAYDTSNKESIPINLLKKYAEQLKVDVIILPDKLFDKKRSEFLEKEFLKLFTKKERKKYKFMKVVCGNNLKEYLISLIEVAEDENVDIIGLSKSRSVIAPNLTFIMNYLISNNDEPSSLSKDIHLLGITHPYELIEAKDWEQIKTCDTGLPINFAFKNKMFPKIKKAEEFIRISGEELTTKKKLDVKLVKENIKILRGYYGIN